MRSRCRNPSLALRLILTFVLALTLCLGVISMFSVFFFALYPEKHDKHIMELEIERIESRLVFDAQGQPIALTPDEWPYRGLIPEDIKFRLVDASGKVLLGTEGPDQTALAPAGKPFNPGLDMFAMTSDGDHLTVMTRESSRGADGYFIQLALSERVLKFWRERISLLPKIPRIALGMGGIGLIAIWLSVMLTVSRMLKPLRDASTQAASISARNLAPRLVAEGVPRELQPLIQAFNSALDRMQQGFQDQQEFLATTAHELKTPLALLRGEIELGEGIARREVLLADIDRIARQVSQLLQLAEVRDLQSYRFAPMNMRELAAEVIHYLERLAARHEVSLVLLPGEDLPCAADHAAVFILVKNLVENAINHSPAGACISITLDAQSLQVRDYGKGVSPEHADFIFRRFWRAPARRMEGAGLGLAICREVADAHGWHLAFGNAEPGTVFTLRIR